MIQSLASLRKFPNVLYHPELHLLTWHQDGVLDDAMADRIVEVMECQERDSPDPFDRYIDFGGLLEIRISLAHTFHIAQRRRIRYSGPPSKTAYYASWVMARGLARVYADFMRDSPIDVQVFERREDAAAWLGVPVSVLIPKGGVGTRR